MKILKDIAEIEVEINRFKTQIQLLKIDKDKLVNKLKAMCVHPETYDAGYDQPDGYGGDRWISNRKCKICDEPMNNKG